MNGEATKCQYENPHGGMLMEKCVMVYDIIQVLELSGSVPSSMAGAILLCPQEQEKTGVQTAGNVAHQT